MWKIISGLYLGDRKDAQDAGLLHWVGITHILNCAVEVPCWYPRTFVYKHLDLTDPCPEFDEYIPPICSFIRKGRRRGAVLVHCAAGLNRSPAAILAYLRSRGKTLDKALDLLARGVGEDGGDFIQPDALFLEQIEIHFGE